MQYLVLLAGLLLLLLNISHSQEVFNLLSRYSSYCLLLILFIFNILVKLGQFINWHLILNRLILTNILK
jgi:hypothetical protein